MTADDDGELLEHLAILRDRAMGALAAIDQVQLKLARRAADRAECQRLEREQFPNRIRDTLD